MWPGCGGGRGEPGRRCEHHPPLRRPRGRFGGRGGARKEGPSRRAFGRRVRLHLHGRAVPVRRPRLHHPGTGNAGAARRSDGFDRIRAQGDAVFPSAHTLLRRISAGTSGDRSGLSYRAGRGCRPGPTAVDALPDRLLPRPARQLLSLERSPGPRRRSPNRRAAPCGHRKDQDLERTGAVPPQIRSLPRGSGALSPTYAPEKTQRACWKSRIAATRRPITMTAARAFSRPIRRANPAPP